MTFKNTVLSATAITALVATAGTANAFNPIFPDYDAIKGANITGTNFTSELAREYQDLSTYEFTEMYDYIDAETYAAKGLMARSGKVPAPFKPEQWGIDDAGTMNDLKSARLKLVDALSKGAPSIAPGLAANAQTKFDCWVEQAEEGWQKDHIAACREGFESAMNQLWAAMTPPEPVEQVSSVEPAEETVVAAAPEMTIDREVIYFDFDKSTLNTLGRTTIDTLAGKLKDLDDISIRVEGHTDRAGSTDYNQKLAEARAQTVREALIGHGLNVYEVDEFVVESEGESNPAVETDDGVREALNRRVVITMKGKFEQAL